MPSFSLALFLTSRESNSLSRIFLCSSACLSYSSKILCCLTDANNALLARSVTLHVLTIIFKNPLFI
jgi:hypothetical protein